jgi:hypothetical protein
MRYLRLFCASVMLICALAFSAHAGNIECDAIVSQPPPPTPTSETSYPVTQVAVSVIQSVLSLS